MGLPENEKEVILDAIGLLAPKLDSPILKVDVSGKAVRDIQQPVSLTTNIHSVIKKQFPTEHMPRLIERTGLVREVDKDAQTFALRMMRGFKPDASQRFWFDKKDEPIIYRHLQNDKAVVVSGEMVRNRYQVAKIEPAARG